MFLLKYDSSYFETPSCSYKYNTSVNNTTLYLYTIKIVYYQGDMFRPLLGHLQALWENRSKNVDSSWICFLRGPEDDLIKVETCRPHNILFLLYTNKVLYYWLTCCTGWRKRTHFFNICLRFLSLGLPQIKSLRLKTSYIRWSESFHSRRNRNCATRNVSKCDAELWGEAPDVCMARRTPSFRYNFP